MLMSFTYRNKLFEENSASNLAIRYILLPRVFALENREIKFVKSNWWWKYYRNNHLIINGARKIVFTSSSKDGLNYLTYKELTRNLRCIILLLLHFCCKQIHILREEEHEYPVPGRVCLTYNNVNIARNNIVGAVHTDSLY